jgi:2-polyprenyl-3-methyl-5-hydroxy-6-metoxy-1,4-benzoquinol methylase
MSADPHVASPRSESEERAFYDDVWNKFGHLDVVSPANFHRRRLVVDLAARAVRSASPRVLDVGCGQGELLRDLAARLPNGRISGSDLSAQSLLDTRKRNREFELFSLNIADPKFAETYAARVASFDLVVCSEVLEHIPDDRLAAHNLAALLAPEGVLIATVPGGKMSRFDQRIGHQRHYRPQQLEQLLAGAGLRVEKVMAWGFPFHNVYRSAVRIASRLAMPDGPAPAAAPAMTAARPAPSSGGTGPGWMSKALSGGYVAFGRILNPLFYLNLARGGEQMIAVARATT